MLHKTKFFFLSPGLALRWQIVLITVIYCILVLFSATDILFAFMERSALCVRVNIVTGIC